MALGGGPGRWDCGGLGKVGFPGFLLEWRRAAFPPCRLGHEASEQRGIVILWPWAWKTSGNMRCADIHAVRVRFWVKALNALIMYCYAST